MNYDTYKSRLDKWRKFDNLMAEAIIAGRDYTKFKKLRDAITPKLKEAEAMWEMERKMWYDHAKREIAKEGMANLPENHAPIVPIN